MLICLVIRTIYWLRNHIVINKHLTISSLLQSNLSCFTNHLAISKSKSSLFVDVELIMVAINVFGIHTSKKEFLVKFTHESTKSFLLKVLWSICFMRYVHVLRCPITYIYVYISHLAITKYSDTVHIQRGVVSRFRHKK